MNPYSQLQSFLKGRFSEVVVYAGVMDSVSRKAVEDSLIARYEILSKPQPPANDPRQILHLRADTGVLLDANCRVKLWKDLSPRHTDFGTPNLGQPHLVFVTPNFDTAEKRVYKTLDSDSLLRPRLVQQGIGGLAAVAFDGVQTLVDTTSLPLDSGFTLFIVAQDSSGKGVQSALLDKAPGDLVTNLWNGVDGNFQMGVGWVQNIAKSSLETPLPTLYESSWNGRTGSIWANGQFLDSGSWNGTVQRSKSTWLGAVLNPYADLQGFLKGQISEVVVYAGELDSASRKAVEDSLIAKFGIISRPLPPANDPRQILHLRADTGVILDANGRVKLWKDLSPRHTDFGTSTLGTPHLVFVTSNIDTASKRVYATLASDSLLRPRLVQKGIGGLPAVAFDGAQTLADTSSLPLDSGFTLFIVAQDSSGQGVQSALLDKAPGDLNTDLWNGIDGNFQMGVSWVENIAKSSLETPLPTLYESSWDGSTGSIWANGQFLDSGSWNGTVQRNKSAWLGAVLNPDADLEGFLKGQISEVVVYKGTLTNTERQIAENGLLARYSIHPATTSLRKAGYTKPSVRFLPDGLEITAAGEGRVCARSLDGRMLAQAQLTSGTALLPRLHGAVLLSVYSAGQVHSQLLMDPLR